MPQPLVFLDVDGTLLPFGRPAAGSGTVRWFGDHQWLDTAVCRGLRRLPGRLVWASAWEHAANADLAPQVGVPELPVVQWPQEPPPAPRGVHWKTPTLIDWARGRPFAWIDDEITDADRARVAADHPGDALLVAVDPLRGLTLADIAELTGWLHRAAA